MNTEQNPREPGHPAAEQGIDRTPAESFDPAGGDRAPDAVREAEIARRDATRKAFLDVPGRGVEWVRPTDLIARHSGQLAGRGIDIHTELARRTRATTAAGVHRVSDRARRLPPASEFGRRGAARSGPDRSGVGMRLGR